VTWWGGVGIFVLVLGAGAMANFVWSATYWPWYCSRNKKRWRRRRWHTWTLFSLSGSNQTFLGVDFSDQDLRRMNFDGAHFIDCNFNGACLFGVGLAGVHFERSSLVGADLRRARLSAAAIYECDLSVTNFSGADLSRAFVTRSAMTGTNLNSVRADDSVWNRSEFFCVEMEQASLRRSHLDSVTFTQVSARGADLSASKLTNANLVDSDMRDCALSNADLSRAEVHGGDWQGVDVEGAYLFCTDLGELPRAWLLTGYLDLGNASGLQTPRGFRVEMFTESAPSLKLVPEWSDALGAWFADAGVDIDLARRLVEDYGNVEEVTSLLATARRLG